MLPPRVVLARPLDLRAVALRALVPDVPLAELREPVLAPPDFAAPVRARVPVDAFLVPVEREPVEAPAVVERDAVERDAVERLAVDRFAVERVPVERVPVERVPVEREPVERLLVLRPVEPPEPPDDARELPPLSSSVQLPLSTRCAASATASAISEPSRVALDIAVVAALDAASAASRPASRILRRAAGLALIAAAAAASPAASISRLIAALVILSTVVSFEPEEELELEEDFLPDFAIFGLPLSGRKTLQTRNGSRIAAGSHFGCGECRHVKGDRRVSAIPFDMVSGRRFRPLAKMS